MSGRGKGAEIRRSGEPCGRHCNARSNGAVREQSAGALCAAAPSRPGAPALALTVYTPPQSFGTRARSLPLLPTGLQHLVSLSAWEVTPRGKKKKKNNPKEKEKKITRSVWVAKGLGGYPAKAFCLSRSDSLAFVSLGA